MKAISLWQPWASLMAAGIKKLETRGRLTHFRGELAICSAQRRYQCKELSPNLQRIVYQHRDKLIITQRLGEEISQGLPYGQVLAVVEVWECYPTSSFTVGDWNPMNPFVISSEEHACGDFRAGRFAWLTRNCRRLPAAVPVTGRQGFFELPAAVEKSVRAQL